MITLIAAIGINNEIGLNNRLLWKCKEDMLHFKNYTTGKIVVMGSKTFDSLGNKHLPNRVNVVVGKDYIPTLEDALNSVADTFHEIVIIGGESIYRQTIDIADKLVITHIAESFTADKYFPEIDLSKWKINTTKNGSNDAHHYRFVEYVRHETK